MFSPRFTASVGFLLCAVVVSLATGEDDIAILTVEVGQKIDLNCPRTHLEDTVMRWSIGRNAIFEDASILANGAIKDRERYEVAMGEDDYSLSILKIKKEDDNAKITCLMVDENGDSTNIKIYRLKFKSAEEPVTEETVPVPAEEAVPTMAEKKTPDVVAVVTEAIPAPTKKSEPKEGDHKTLDPVPGSASSFSLCSTLATVMVTIYALAL